MNLFNRIITVVTILVLTLLGLGVLFVPRDLSLLTTSAMNLVDITQGGIRALIAILVLAVAVFLLWLEIRRPGSRTVEVSRATGGHIRITTGHVEERISQQVNALSGILAARVRVAERDNAVVAWVNVQAAPDLDLVAKGEEIAAVTRIAVQDQLGLKLYAKPHVTIQSGKMKPVPVSPVPATPIGDSDHTTPVDKK